MKNNYIFQFYINKTVCINSFYFLRQFSAYSQGSPNIFAHVIAYRIVTIIPYINNLTIVLFLYMYITINKLEKFKTTIIITRNRFIICTIVTHLANYSTNKATPITGNFSHFDLPNYRRNIYLMYTQYTCLYWNIKYSLYSPYHLFKRAMLNIVP